MIGLDTNLLVRYLAQDDAVQSPQSNRIIDRQLSLQEPGFISLATMIETVWVLGSRYKMTGAAVAAVVERILAADTLVVQNEQEVFRAMIALKTGAGSFVDTLIGALGIWAGCSTTLTFDRGASRLHGFQLV
jgi:predicted nucleic-acid-binding protein